MPNVDSAVVQTLTAEVHVLQVASRQVTLSVAKQLDLVPYTDIEPMGRVRTCNSNVPEIIGRHKDTGALVRCFLSEHQSECYKVWGRTGRCTCDVEYYVAQQNWSKLPLIVLAGLK